MSKKITLDYVLVFHVHWRIYSLQINKCVLIGALHCHTPLYSLRVLASCPFAFSKYDQRVRRGSLTFRVNYRIIGNVCFGVCCSWFLSHVNDAAITSNAFLQINRRRLSISGSKLLTFKFTLFILFYFILKALLQYSCT